MAGEDRIERMKRMSKDQDSIRNIATSAHIHHGKTALTDNLLAAAGFMSEAAAGVLDKGMATWQHADEQERLMTVDAANVSMVHEFDGKEFLINMIDTPGHIDFGGNVTRAMRAIDGTIVLVCASEGIMPQTETVLKQALRERVKPVLFINQTQGATSILKYEYFIEIRCHSSDNSCIKLHSQIWYGSIRSTGVDLSEKCGHVIINGPIVNAILSYL